MMLKSLSLVFLIPIFLTSCTPSHTQGYIRYAVDTELSAWSTTQERYEVECPYGAKDKPVPRKKAVQNTDCYEAIAREEVLPVAIDASDVNALLLSYRQNSIDYKKGKIDKDELKLNGQKLWMNYTNTIDKKLALYAHQKQQQGAWWANAITAMNTEAQRQELHRAQVNALENSGGGSCFYNPSNGTHQQCLHMGVNGQCHHYGMPCN